MLRVFSDFDGTIAVEDVGSQIFRTFVGARANEIVGRYLDGTIDARTCLTRECQAVDSLTPADLERFIEKFELDATFGAFVQFCRDRAIPLVVLSDGLDFYVQRLLTRNGYGSLPLYSNHLEFLVDDSRTKLIPSFPYTDSECTQCGNCKRNHVLTLSGDDDIIVYIGDGISDRCPVKFADIVFAKGRLIRYCQELNITYHEFGDFADVVERLGLILQQKRIKKRREAAMARREVFAQG